MPNSEGRYNIQCIAGHVCTAPPGSDEEKKAIKHAEKYLDAVCVSSDECYDCAEDRASRARRDAEYDMSDY